MTTKWMDRLMEERRANFVGRKAEIDLFQKALDSVSLPFLVLYFYGPGGIGKTSLLSTLRQSATEQGLKTVNLNGRNIEPSPPLFLSALQEQLGSANGGEIPAQFSTHGERTILLIDTYEDLRPLDDWLRDEFLPQLPDNVLVILAGRHPPGQNWLEDPGWQSLMRIRKLDNLAPSESRAYLTRRDLPGGEYEAILSFTHGHPLALSLVAETYAQQPDAGFQIEEASDVIQMLVERIVDNAPGPLYRQALEAMALVRVMNEPLLAQMLDTAEVGDAFAWLRELSFMDAEPGGLFPHDLAREALTRDLRWRNPHRFETLHRRARAYYTAQIATGDESNQRQSLNEYVYLHRDNPMVRPYFEWRSGGRVITDLLHPDDVPWALQLIERYEGAEAARLAAVWLEREPHQNFVFRTSEGEAQGLLILVFLEQLKPEQRENDPALSAAAAYLENSAPLRPGERATFFRFWMSQENYQDVSPVQSRIFLNIVQHYLTTPALAFTFLPCADPEFWQPAFTYADLRRIPEAGFSVGGRTYGVYGHDWRLAPPAAWLELLAERELSPQVTPPEPAEQTVQILSKEAFTAAVRQALRDLHDQAALGTNPLLAARLVKERPQGDQDPVAILQELVGEAAGALQDDPRSRKFYRALYHTYLQPAPTQEAAAEILDLPFSTYRRHLRRGIAAVADRLWALEIGTA